jgi:hypothetical protein
MKHNGRWTEADDQKLAALRAEGKSMRAIATALKRTTAAVEARAYILRTKADPAAPEEKFEEKSEKD